MKAYRTFEEAWAVATEAVRQLGGTILHDSAAACYQAHVSETYGPFLTDRWKVGQLGVGHEDGCTGADAEVGASHAVGPTLIYKLEL